MLTRLGRFGKPSHSSMLYWCRAHHLLLLFRHGRHGRDLQGGVCVFRALYCMHSPLLSGLAWTQQSYGSLVEPCCSWFYECLETYEVPLADGRCCCSAQGPWGWLLRWVQHSGSCSSRDFSTGGRTIKLRTFTVCWAGMLVFNLLVLLGLQYACSWQVCHTIVEISITEMVTTNGG